MTAPVLEARGLSAAIEGRPGVAGVSLTLWPGEASCLLGRHGMGKSTVLAALAGLIRPSAGRLHLFGRDVTGLPAERLAELGLALVPQGGGLFPDLSARENLLLGLRQGAPGAALDRVLARFPCLAAGLDRPAGSLPGSERALLALGRAVLGAPRLVLLDEPTEGLAAAERSLYGAALARLRDEGVALLVAARQPRPPGGLFERAVVIAGGRLVFAGTARALHEAAAVRARWLLAAG